MCVFSKFPRLLMGAMFAAFILTLLSVSIQAQSNIRKVDFKNFSYRLSCGGADRMSLVKVQNGEYSGVKESLNDRVYLNVTEIIYGDLDRDGKEEAVVLYSCGSGASYVYIWGLIYTLRNGKPVLVTQLEGGNKGDGGFHDVKIKRKQLVVERYQLGTAGSPCCPVSIETTKYKLIGKKLKRVGRSKNRSLPKTD